MTEQIMMDGEPLEVGDRVWCLLRGWLKFDGVFHAGVCAYFPLRFINKNGEQVTYTQAFQIMAGSNRTLYWDEIKVIPPPKPKGGKVMNIFDEQHQAQVAARAHQYFNNADEVMREQLRPFYLLRPRIFPDGNQWCALYGDNIQDGVCAFGSTPAEAATRFDEVWQTEKPGLNRMKPNARWRDD